MIEAFEKFINEKARGAKPLLITIRGSQAYGTAIETSDTDYAGVYIQPETDLLGCKYIEQINDKKGDTVFYELKRFIELVATNNPNILEMLAMPEDCIIYKHPLFDEIILHKHEFITKMCAKSFAGYAIQQIKKAKGQDKKQNWEKGRVERKTPMDFCYIHVKEQSYELKEYLEKNMIKQELCGLSKIPHSRDVYALFYDPYIHNKFHGIIFENSNDLRLSSIPTGMNEYFIGHISYNKDGYSQHCAEYKSYQDWLNNKNDQRWVESVNHGQKIDGKNMMHCRRLIEMAIEIAEGKGIIVKRPNREELLSIRRGEVDLQTLIDRADADINKIDELFAASDLPDHILNRNLVHNLIVDVRQKFYNYNSQI